jgi:hypothetical protein
MECWKKADVQVFSAKLEEHIKRSRINYFAGITASGAIPTPPLVSTLDAMILNPTKLDHVESVRYVVYSS